jgi:hypothetical protein
MVEIPACGMPAETDAETSAGGEATTLLTLQPAAGTENDSPGAGAGLAARKSPRVWELRRLERGGGTKSSGEEEDGAATTTHEAD